MTHATQKAWMWAVDDAIYGLNIDLNAQKLEWYDDIDCFCAGDNRCAVQTIIEFTDKGVPFCLLDVPDDVLEEIQSFIALG